MPIEVWSVVLGTILGFALSGVLSVWQRNLQRKDAEQDWHRNNQRDIDWKAQDFVIEVQAFANDCMVMESFQFFDSTRRLSVFNQTKAIELIARANAFEARVADSELKTRIQSLNTELLVASNKSGFGNDNRATVHAHCQKFYFRISKLYANTDQVADERSL